MGLKADRTDRILDKHREPLLRKLYDLNRFSKHLDFPQNIPKDKDKLEATRDQIRLQAICISEFGRIVEQESGLERDRVVKGMEFIFEKKNKKWRGEDTSYFLKRLGDLKRMNTYTLANILKRISNTEFGIEKRVIKNHWHYMSNGYKEMLRKGVLW